MYFDVCISRDIFSVVGFNVNIKDLYHGTSSPLDQICTEGLDPRVSVHGHFGRGIYFRFATNQSDYGLQCCILECYYVVI